MGKLKIFRFNKKGTTDLSGSPEFGCNVIQCGKNRFTLKDFRKQSGHDDSLPYTAILCMNNKPICRCTNDGWGGLTDTKPINLESEVLMKSIEVNLKNYKWGYMGGDFVLTIDFIADILACTHSHA